MRKLFSHLILLKYSILPNDYNNIIINQLLSNKNLHIVSIFKDYLLYDDPSEFLKRFYNKEEIKSKLIILTKYYENSSKLYPNYSALNERNYIFNNIRKKQKIIDLFEIFKYGKLNDKLKNENNKFFNSDIYNSILQENINDKSKMKDLFGSNIFNNENGNDSVKSIINLTDKLTDFIKQNKKEDYLNNNNYTKTRITSTNSNKIWNNYIKEKINLFPKHKINNTFTKLIKYNPNNLKQKKNCKNNLSKLSLDKEKIYSKLKEKNLSTIKRKNKYPYSNKNIYKHVFLKNKSKNNHSSIQSTNLQTSFKFDKQHNYILSMPNEFKLDKANKINKIKELLNKSLKKKYLTSNYIFKINSNNSNKLLFPESERKKIYIPNMIIKANKNVNIRFELNNSLNNRKSSNSEKKKRKHINIMS